MERRGGGGPSEEGTRVSAGAGASATFLMALMMALILRTHAYARTHERARTHISSQLS